MDYSLKRDESERKLNRVVDADWLDWLAVSFDTVLVEPSKTFRTRHIEFVVSSVDPGVTEDLVLIADVEGFSWNQKLVRKKFTLQYSIKFQAFFSTEGDRFGFCKGLLEE